MTKKTEEPEDAVETTMSERFMEMVQTQFEAEIGADLQWDQRERLLAQHLYIKADQQLASLEAKRLDSNNADKRMPIKWSNVNLPKMALDSVHRIALGLDALIPNHIHIIPYFNGRLKKYDLDLRIGYQGQDYIRREMALDKPIDIRYELVHENDKFEPQPKDSNRDVEGYIFQITKPWERGPVVGGFGYIIYGDETKNDLVLVTMEDFNRARIAAKTGEFWQSSEPEMQRKTVVHRTTSRIILDPSKINTRSYAYVEDQERPERVPLLDGTGDENSEPLEPEEPEISDEEAAAIEEAERQEQAEQGGGNEPGF